MAAPTTLPIIDRTPIEFESDISFCNSELFIRLDQPNIKSAFIYIYIWNGKQNKVLSLPNYTLFKSKVSANDDYLSFEISEIIKAYLVAPPNAPNTNQPTFSYNQFTAPAITGQGVFWQIVADVTDRLGTTTRYNYRTSFATLGYRYRNEQSASVPYSATLPNVARFSNPKVHDYFTQEFDFTKSVAEATTGNIVKYTAIEPTTLLRCSLDPYIIVYVNKIGVWDVFTPNGKVVTSVKKEMTTSALNYRDPSRIDNSYVHSKITDNFQANESITINTGSLTEEMVQLVEQIIYSPKVYLIKFKGDVNITTTIGITIDNTYISIDDLNTTIDGMSVTSESQGKFKSHEQIPVVLVDTDFTLKNRVNDKNTIDYNLKFETTKSKL